MVRFRHRSGGHWCQVWSWRPWRGCAGGSQEDAVECYDLIEDPLEQRPLTVGQWPPGAQKLYQDLLNLLSRSSARTGEEELGPDSLAPEIEEGLRALGYVE